MVGETTPLLATPGNKGAAIPYGQLALLCYARWIDGWFFFTIFPYIARMISDTGVPAGDVGYYSGIIESSYSLVECVTLLFFWTDVSDRWGRRPVMIVCLAGLAISGTLFGFSTHIWQMIACRALSGAFSGCVGAMRVMLSELSTQETESRMLSIWASADSLGILLAPIAGGLLARPVDQYAFFKGWALFEDYPYLLPSLLMGALGGSCTVLCFFGLKETLATKETQSQDAEGTITYTSLLKLPHVPYVLCNSVNLQALVFAWIAVEPIFCYADVKRGGLGFSIRQISLVLACTATTSTLVLLLFFPYCERRFRIRGCLYITAIASIAAGLLPAFANLARRRLPADGPMFWVLLAGSLLAASSQSAFGRSATQLMVNNMAPTSASLGKLNSLTLALNMAGRTLSPAAASALYAYGVGHGILKGQLAWVVFTVCSIGYAISLAWYPKQADSRQRSTDE